MRPLCLFVVAAAAVLVAGQTPAAAQGGLLPAQEVRENSGIKASLVDQLISNSEQRSAREWDAASKENLKQGLLARPLAELAEAAASDRGLELLMGGKALGSALNDWVFTPLPSCRILDTRPISGDGTGPLAPGTARAIFASGVCGVPFPSAKAVSVNFIAALSAGNGNLRVWPWDSTNPPQPGTALLTYTNGFSASNAAIIPVCNTATSTGGTCSADLFVQANANSTHVIADVFGYFAAPVATALDCTTLSNTGTIPAGPGAFFTMGSPNCAAGYTLTGGGIDTQFSSAEIWTYRSSPNGTNNGWACHVNSQYPATWPMICSARCCRVPGR